ncbi:MAG: GTP cyclohydrolase II [Magnetovibrio sp.]|nr:GTP cyclohydrolase II [Magnetovibrio sp.]
MPHRQDTTSIPEKNDPYASLSVQRAVFELRCGRMIVVRSSDTPPTLVLAAENVNADNLSTFKRLSAHPTHLALTAARAKALKLIVQPQHTVLILQLNPEVTAESLHQYADPLHVPPAIDGPANQLSVAGVGARAGVGLVKIAHLLPTALIGDLSSVSDDALKIWCTDHNVLMVDADDVFQSDHYAAQTLARVSEALVPLMDAESARVVAYRPINGGLEHLAIVIGDPQHSPQPPLVRIHSQCFTGDLLASLRCDCGDQLRGAIQAIAADGSGVVLYLAQEGRGIGLVNKLRAYVLQDQGTDTLDANESLGFDADERVYLPAATMLNDLGLTRVRLLTNNPTKVQALLEANIDVVERVAHAFPSNRHNEAYLRTKKIKGGHLL